MITDRERQLIRAAEAAEDIEASARIARDSANPEFLVEFVAAHNFDTPDTLVLVQSAIDNPHCDLGAALSIFWLLEGLSVITGDIERVESNADWFDLCTRLGERLKDHHYSPGPVSFEPPTWNRLHEHKLRKAGVDPVFFEAVVGVLAEP